MKVALLTLGCKVNQAESAVLEGTLKESGAKIVTLEDNPDFCIINTCSVTAKSDYNSRQLIRRAHRAGARVIVTGCYSQMRPEFVRQIEGVSDLVDNKKKGDIVKIITGKDAPPFFGYHGRSRPFLKIQDGCNFRCSYCTVPIARGRSVSTPPEEVTRRVQEIESQGYNEVVLTGIHLSAYGKDLGRKTSLSRLLRVLLLQTSIGRIRLSSLGVKEIDKELIDILKEKRICNHIHLPLQSGSNKILHLMKRNYSVEIYSNIVETLSEVVGNLSIGTDVIVGFPCEEDKDYEETRKLLMDLPFAYIHLFPYSPRPGTEAFRMKRRPDALTVRGRMEELQEIVALKKKEFLRRQMGSSLEVVLEESDGLSLVCGTSSNYVKVLMIDEGRPKGSLVTVRPAGFLNGVIVGTVMG